MVLLTHSFYIAPEVLHVGIMSKAADIYSFGIILHEVGWDFTGVATQWCPACGQCHAKWLSWPLQQVYTTNPCASVLGLYSADAAAGLPLYTHCNAAKIIYSTS